jgi:hypothetical protein
MRIERPPNGNPGARTDQPLADSVYLLQIGVIARYRPEMPNCFRVAKLQLAYKRASGPLQWWNENFGNQTFELLCTPKKGSESECHGCLTTLPTSHLDAAAAVA